VPNIKTCTEKKKILLVISNLEFGGAQRQIVELANNINKEKFEVHIYSLSNYVPLAEHLAKNIKLHIVNKRFKFDFLVVIGLIKLIKSHQFAIGHAYLFDAEISVRLSGFFSFSGIKVLAGC